MIVRVALALAVASAAFAPWPAEAFRPAPDTGASRAKTGDGLVLRTQRDIAWDAPPPASREAWRGFREDRGPSWRSTWDVATRIPSRIFGEGIAAPGAVGSAAAAERAAREVLEKHRELLAPGSEPGDFELVANERDGDLRSVGFAQYHNGVRVVGGQVSFRFRNDRLFAIGSEALPHVRVDGAGPPLPEADVRRAATESARARAAAFGEASAERGVELRAGEVEEPVILPLVGERRVHGYRAAARVDVRSDAPGERWDVYVDANTGEFLARERRAHPSTVIHFEAPVRRPTGERDTYLARYADVRVDDEEEQTDESGTVLWFGEDEAHISVRPEGRYVNLFNQAGAVAEHGETLEADSSLTSLTWDASDDEHVDAQLAAFTHTQIAADRAEELTSEASWIEDPVDINVNLDATCNAFFDQHAKSINFFQSGENCANTGRLPDVIYHEYGHLLHIESILEGVGQFDGAFSEGAADYFAALITGDPGVGRGFFHDDEALRHLAPEGEEPRSWPEDIADIHTTGLIFGGAMWRLREKLIDEHGEEEGAEIADDLYYAALRRSTDIPSSYIEVLAADDDDGDLTTGTPNICAINSAFGAHGLRTIRGEVDDPGTSPVSEDGHEVGFRVYGIYDQCESDQIESAEAVWRPRGSGEESREPAEPDGDGRFAATIPPQERDTALRYHFEIEFADGGTLRLPQNPADRALDLYVGDVVPLYCTHFEDDPFDAGWTRGARHGANDWEWGPPDAGRQPAFAFRGENVLGTELGGPSSDGTYTPDSESYVASPDIDVGNFTNVRLQYRRWLDVRDGYFDQASIRADDELMWRNRNSEQGSTSSTHHQDRRWRFHDVPLTTVLGSNSVEVTFELETEDEGEFLGWHIDDFCVVADPDAVCGDGVAAGFAGCDEGDENSDVLPDACRTDCRSARCGDGVINSEEECDPAAEDGPPCTDDCRLIEAESGCGGCRAGAGSGAIAAPVILAYVLALAFARRRRGGGALAASH